MRRQRLADALLALALAGVSASVLTSMRGLPAVVWALALTHSAALAFRRRAVLASFQVAMATGGAYVLLGYPMVGLGPAALVWVYTLGWLVPPPRSYRLFSGVEAVAVLAGTIGGQGGVATLVSNVVVLAVAFLLGDGARRRHESMERLRRAQDEQARRAVAEERLRIARELHDVVAHSMSVVAVQAGTGRLLLDTDPAQAREALGVIERTSRAALDEMRRVLGVLRDPDGDGTGRAPAPDLSAVDALVARTVASGVPVALRVEGERRALPQGMELAAFRILQEALTNVARHAPGASATVVLTYGPDGLGIEVTSTRGRRAVHADGGGLGLVGMRERAAVYGGTVEAEPLADGGFGVVATLREAP